MAMRTSVQRVSIAHNRRNDDWSTWNPVTYIRAEWKKEGNERKGRARQSRSGDDSLCRRRRSARACRIRARCICNEGCAPPIADTPRACCIKSLGGCIGSRAGCRARNLASVLARARALLIQPQALKCNPSHGWFIPRQCPPAGQDVARPFFMSLSPVSKISRSARERTSERSLTRTYSCQNVSKVSTMIVFSKTIRKYIFNLKYIGFFYIYFSQNS